MHDQAGIPFDLLCVVAIIMDAVAVECHGRVAEQQRRSGHKAGCVITLRDVPDPLRRAPARAVFAVNQILPLHHGQLSVTTDFMFDGDETQRPAAPLFHHHVLDHGLARNLFSNPQRSVEFERATGLIMAKMVLADGHIDEAEIDSMQDIYGRITGAQVEREAVLKMVEAAQAEPAGAEDIARDFASRLNPSGQELVMKAVILIAMADGDFAKEEQDLVSGIGAALGMSRAHMKGIFADLTEPAA